MNRILKIGEKMEKISNFKPLLLERNLTEDYEDTAKKPSSE